MFEMICEDTMPLAIDAEVDSLAKAVNREIQGTKLPDGVSFRAVVINNKSFKVVVEVSGYGNASIKFKKVEDGWMVEHPNGDIVGFDYRFIRDKGPYSSVEIEQFVLKALNFYRANYPNDQLW